MTTPFVAFERPDLRTVTPETLARGLLLGAVAGSAVPILAVGAELVGGATLSGLAANPTPALLASFLAPALAGGVGAWLQGRVHAHKQAYDSIARKAGTLLDETWDLREQLDAQPVPEPPHEGRPLPHAHHTHLPSDDEVMGNVTWLRPAGGNDADADALIEAQSLLLHSVGSATRDAIRRMQVHVQGLELTPLTLVQERLVRALSGHLEGLWDLAEDVVSYAEEEQQDQDGTSGRARAVA